MSYSLVTDRENQSSMERQIFLFCFLYRAFCLGESIYLSINLDLKEQITATIFSRRSRHC